MLLISPIIIASPDIEEIVINSKDEYLLEGNIFYYHVSLLKCDNNLPKQINLFWIGSLINKRILEIGFNAGHSSEIFLNSNPHSKITSIDVGYWYYGKFGVEFLNNKFPNSTEVINELKLKIENYEKSLNVKNAKKSFNFRKNLSDISW